MLFRSIALATDYDCWHESEEEVTIDAILQVMRHNIEISRKILSDTIETFQPGNGCRCGTALRDSLVTPYAQIPEQVKKDLAPLLAHQAGSE